MKTAKEILEKNVSASRQPSWTSTTPTGSAGLVDNEAKKTSSIEIDQRTKSLINMVFTRFMAIYGHKFKSSFETETEMRIAKREWAMSLAQYSESELVSAVTVSKETLAWAPSIAEFIQILERLQGSIGLVDVRVAFKEACFYAAQPSKHHWSHPTVYHAGRETGWFELRSAQERNIYPQFSYHYEVMCRRFRQGERFEQPVSVAIENKQDTSLSLFINQWAHEQSVSVEVASSLLYFMTKPAQSKARANYRLKSQEKIAKMGLQITLPE